MEKKDWHGLPEEEVLRALNSGRNGLDQGEVERRLEKHGPNVLTEEERTTPLRILLEQFKNFLILILIAAVVVSAAIGEIWLHPRVPIRTGNSSFEEDGRPNGQRDPGWKGTRGARQ
jgi:magnesium-transporting ATPase (P-type)